MVNRSGVGPAFARVRGLVLLVLLVAGAGLLLKHDASKSVSSGPRRLTSAQIRASFSRLPISFEPNQGQTDGRVKFLAQGHGYGLYLSPSEAVLSLPQGSLAGLAPAAVEMRLAGANQQAEMAGTEPLRGHSNYLIGNDPKRWLHNIPQFGRVQYHAVYPGIDLAFYGNQNKLEYDFEVAPGSDARQIELNFQGATNLSVANDGDLVLALADRELRFAAPHIYQKTPAGNQTVAGSFVLRAKNAVGFEIGAYDRSRTLVIDPVLTFSTYLGGAGDESCTVITGATAGFVPHCPSIAVDSGGRIYLAGATSTPAAGPFSGFAPNASNTVTGASDYVFISRISLSSAGGTLDYVTYLGGSTGPQYPVGIGVDNGFNVYVAGTTNAPDFPVTGSAFQSAPVSPGNNHAFVTQLDSSGSLAVYSTYLSGNGVDVASNMTVDSQGRVYVIGTTTSSNFPTTLGALQPAANSANQFFFSRINTALNTTNSLQYSTYIGGSTPVAGATAGVVAGGAVAVDSTFNVYLAGGTNFTDMGSPNPWISNAYQAGEQGGIDVWAAKLNAPANNTQQYTVAYGTYFGGTGDDVAYGIATDGTSTYVTGSTNSVITPTSATTTLSFQKCLDQPPATTTCTAPASPTPNAFVAKFGVPAVSGTTQGTVPLDYFSYLGGSGPQDVGLAIVADSLGNATLTGLTSSATTFPTTASPFQPSYGGGNSDAFIARLNTTGTATSTNSSTSSFLGGSGTDIGTSIVLDSSLNTYVTGETSSPGGGAVLFPTCPTTTSPGCGPNSIPPLAGGGTLAGGAATDAFVVELGPNTSGLTMTNPTPSNALPAPSAANPTVSPSPAGVGSAVMFSYYIYNTGDPVAGVVFTDKLGVNTSTSATASQGSCQTAQTSGTLSCTLGTVNTSTVVTSTPANGVPMTMLNFAARVTVTVTAPNSVQQGASSVGNSAALSFPGGTLPTISGSAPLNDYSVSASLEPPSTSSTIPSGGQVNYSITVAPTGAGFAEQVSLACGSGLPSGANCTFTNNPISTLANGPQSRALAISTTARVTTTVSLFRRWATYAMWLPILGVGLIGGGASRKRRMLMASFFVLLLGTALLQAGCGSGSRNTTTTTGTPAGTYTVTVNAASGSATRTTTVQLTVE
jgi:Beta-propeller repeat